MYYYPFLTWSHFIKLKRIALLGKHHMKNVMGTAGTNSYSKSDIC